MMTSSAGLDVDALGDDVDLSVVLPVYNEKATPAGGERSHLSVVGASPYTFEIIVAEYGSDDGLARELPRNRWHPPHQPSDEPRLGLGAAHRDAGRAAGSSSEPTST
jgi:hypothetical protein